MKLTVLVDNNTLINRYFYGEPGVSYFIESEGKKILFDVGYSDVFVLNAQKLNINLLDLDFLVLSHGHLDHTWGMDSLLRMYTERDISKQKIQTPTVVIHPRTFYSRPRSYIGGSSSHISEMRLSEYFHIQKSKIPIRLTEKLVILGEIPRKNNFECQKPYKKILVEDEEVDDYVLDETDLAYKAEDGIIVITACSHSGVCNIIEYAKEICGDERVIDVIGGFHLLNPSKEQLRETLKYMKELKPKQLHACHCTDLQSKISLSKVANLKEVGVGLKLEYK